MNKDKALELALEELENCADLLKMFDAPIDSCVGLTMLQAEKAITAIKQALLTATPLAAPVQEQAEQLAKLGWQTIECPFCGSSGAQAFPKPAAQPVYDQESLELCNTCGWKTLIPEDGCLNCEREAVAFAKEQLESAYQRGYLDGIGRQCPQCADYRAMYLKVRDELAAEQQREIQRPQPLTDEQISAMCKHTWVFETAKQWVRAIEAAHEIKDSA